jgi:hypothetical protein
MLIGRDAEIATFEQVLAEGKPALIVVAGEPQMGKSRLLQEFRVRAEGKGWRVVSERVDKENNRKALAIDKDTAEQSFLDVTSDLSKRDSAASDTLDQQPQWFEPSINVVQNIGPVAGSEVTGVSISSLRAADPQAPLVKADMIQHHAVQDDRLGSTLMAQLRQRHEAREERRRPTVLLINGYYPTEAFAEWFINHYLDDLCQTRSPVVVVVAAYPDNVKSLAASAKQIIRLGALPEQAIGAYLRKLNDDLATQMEEGEIKEYAVALSKEPGMIGVLTRLLQLEQSIAPLEK